MKILIPKCYVRPSEMKSGAEELPLPLFFLAGPIRGGGDWQYQMSLTLRHEMEELSREFVIACPSRWKDDHPLAPYFVKSPEGFEYQLNWERYYLGLAGSYNHPGCVIFWLPRESKEFPHPGPEPYAMDTRGELGEWRWRMKTEKARVVIGAESEFFGLSQIQRNFDQALGGGFTIHRTMEETASAAIGKVILGDL